MHNQIELSCKQSQLTPCEEVSSTIQLKEMQLVLDSARLITANKARAMEVLEAMVAKLNANSVVRITTNKEVY